MLNHLSHTILEEKAINYKRTYRLNTFFSKDKKGKVVYLITREYRVCDNFALDLAKEYDNLEIWILLHSNKFFQKEFSKRIEEFREFNIKTLDSESEIINEIEKNDISILIKDFNPLDNLELPKDKFSIIEVDGHNIVPARIVSGKQEYYAVPFRNKIYLKLNEFLKEYPHPADEKSKILLTDFINNKLEYYAEKKNDPNENVTSHLSPYFNFGFIAPQRAAIDVIKSNCRQENKEAFLDELIIRRELADNFCFYNKKYKTLNGIANWAKLTIKEHAGDVRVHIYTKEQFENAQTHEPLWNAAQKQLVKEGRIHGYMRMYWAKKILEWSDSTQTALKIAIYLNDKYAFDAPSPNGYTNILWSIGGLHDRAFPDRPVYGKIRSMTLKGIKGKFDINKYIAQFS